VVFDRQMRLALYLSILIIDEIGVRPYAWMGGYSLLALVSPRVGRASIILISNKISGVGDGLAGSISYCHSYPRPVPALYPRSLNSHRQNY